MFKRLILISTMLVSTVFAEDDINDLLLGEAKYILQPKPKDDSTFVADSIVKQIVEEQVSNSEVKQEIKTDYAQYAVKESRQENTNYFVEAGKYYNVEPWLIWAMGKVESGHNPRAVNRNKNGTYDIGIMQINSIHLKRLSKYGIRERDLYTPKVNIFVGAFILKECINKYGNNWNAVSCYNGMSEENRKYFTYAKKVQKALNSGLKMAQR